MPPKKPAANDKKGGAQQLIDEDYSDLPTLPSLNNYIFTALFAFKYKKNVQQLHQALLKQFQYLPEDPLYLKNRTITKEDIIERAKLKQYITEEEALDISKVSPDKQFEIFTKVTNELILSIEVPARRLKRDAIAINPSLSQSQDVDMTIWLKDFPQSLTEFQALFNNKQSIQGIYLIEEQFQREQEDDLAIKFQPDPTMEPSHDEEAIKQQEFKNKTEFSKEYRLQIFQTSLSLNKIAKTSPLDINPDARQTHIFKKYFKGPDPPALTTDEESDEFRRDQELAKYQEFSQEFKAEIEKTSKELQEYRFLKQSIKLKPLMPYPVDPLQQKREEEERLKEEKRKQEEEKKAQELALQLQQAQAKGGKAPAKTVAQNANTKSKETLKTVDQAQKVEEQKKKEEEDLLKKKSQKKSRDEEEKEWNFVHLDKILSEIKPGTFNIGSMLAAMIYQIEQQNIGKKVGQQQHPVVDNILSKLEEQEVSLGDHFDDIFNKLQIEHSVQEAAFNHQFSPRLVNKNLSTSPYQRLFNENDQVSQLTQQYTFLNGDDIQKSEVKTLQNCNLPGINQRLGMPAVPSVQQAQRESDQSAIIQYCPLAQAQTKRCLILRQFEEMLKSKQPERDFNFLDRNYVEQYDSMTLRQELAKAFSKNSEIIHQYYAREDALLLSIYFKNPPGRLLRRQWTYPIKVFPEFSQWKKYVKDEEIPLDKEKLYDIDTQKVGFIRSNTKYSFPSDNSVIIVNKDLIGNRRLGSSLIIKDNFTFGVRESNNKFKDEVGGEEDIVNIETFQQLDRRSDMWIEFENGAKLLVEMVDHLEAHIEEIPLIEPLPQQIEDELRQQVGASQMSQDEQLTPNTPAQPQVVQPLASPKGATANKNVSPAKGGALSKNASQSSLKGAPATQKVQANAKDASVVQQQMQKNDSQKSLADLDKQEQAKKDEIINREVLTRLKNPYNKPVIYQDKWDPTKGAKMTFTYDQGGLIVQILPNGDVSQSIIENPIEKKKYGGTVQDSKSAGQSEKSRLITAKGNVIINNGDGNAVIYFPDGTVTNTDKRKGIWSTINTLGIKRVRKLKNNEVYDEAKKMKIQEKIDPETSAIVQVREDGVMIIKYVDGKKLVQMPDGTQIITRKEGEQGTAIVITKEGYAPVRQIFDPVKARSRTVIGLGGTDSLMGIDTVMERSSNGRITEVILPDKTLIQSYLERQELEGYNNFCTNQITLIRRDDFSVIKVKQDGEVVLITANERSYLNDIGKQKEFGVKDYDYFFELFGIPSERRSGVYTANLDQRKIWTQDEEGNVFIVYSNGNSVEKLSVSFNLDQMVEGIENKEPSSPKIKDGEYIEEECKFLPPPKTIDHPRLILIKNDVGYEYFNKDQLQYFFRCKHKDQELLKSNKSITIENQDAVSHLFLKKVKNFNPLSVLGKDEFPKIPTSAELINQTISVSKEPINTEYLWRNVIEYKEMSKQDIEDFNMAIKRYKDLRQRQQDEKKRLKVEEVKNEEQKQVESKIWMRIAKQRGVDVSKLVGDEYKELKDIFIEEKRQKFLDELESKFFD